MLYINHACRSPQSQIITMNYSSSFYRLLKTVGSSSLSFGVSILMYFMALQLEC
ncbi:hypothetical protein HanXRQr2_Chr09g0397441 [Helianthus annuus]|uniref:Uncharacterized protein n=1 Tax=Helianthus annuus TaxID=4232 RepID=A0A9K3I896_HELAN|nr:hypothetical protein HanXRQr2_Chr09g0397441 [Helianthus annuus]